MKQAGETQVEIAQAIGFSQSAIIKELSRNHGERGYRPAQAERFATERKNQKRTRPKVMVGIIKDEVEARLRIKHSPDQISESLVLLNFNVSHETAYQHIADNRKAGGDLSLNLRINGRRRYHKRSKIGRGEKIPNRVDIEKRPAIVSRRKRYGDWEADLTQGGAGSGFLLSIYQRKSRIGRLHQLPDKSSPETMKGIVAVLHGLKVSSITYEIGLEFTMHRLVNELLEYESYFCKPYRSWEKGGVENYNGLVRQCFQKTHDFATITPERLLQVQDEINNRPRNHTGSPVPERPPRPHEWHYEHLPPGQLAVLTNSQTTRNVWKPRYYRASGEASKKPKNQFHAPSLCSFSSFVPAMVRCPCGGRSILRQLVRSRDVGWSTSGGRELGGW